VGPKPVQVVLVTTTKQRLHKKITQHLRAAGIQRYFHVRGPKWYTTAELVLGLAVRERYKLSYRRAATFLDEHYGLALHWTTLQKAAARLPQWFWHRVLNATAQVESMLAAIDGTGFARSLPSEHYVHVNGKRPSVPVKLSAMIDVESRRVLSARVRVRPAHDVRDVHGLVRRAYRPPWSVVMDKGYDSEPLHEWLDNKGVWSISPPRQGCRQGRHRITLRDAFPQSEYDQRSVIESVFRSVKARYGCHVRGKRARTVHAELMMRLILHNLRVVLHPLFLLTSPYKNLYNLMIPSTFMRIATVLLITFLLIGCQPADVQPEVTPDVVPEEPTLEEVPEETDVVDTVEQPEEKIIPEEPDVPKERNDLKVIQDKTSGTTGKGPLSNVKCVRASRKMTFTITNPTQLTWQLDKDLPWPTPSGMAIASITLNSYTMNAQQDVYFEGEKMFGPKNQFSKNCDGDALLEPGEKITCSVWPTPLQTGVSTFDQSNKLVLNAPGVFTQLSFTC